MELAIRKPAYYEQHYPMDKEIMIMYDFLMKDLSDKTYSLFVDHMDIVPVVAPQSLLDQGLWEEEVMYSKSISRVSVFKQIDFESYVNGDIETRIHLIVESIIEAGKMVKKRRTTKFNAKEFEKDVLDSVERFKKQYNFV